MAKKFGHLYWDPVDSAVFKDAVKRYTPKTMGGKVATATAGGLGLMAMFNKGDESLAPESGQSRYELAKDRFGFGTEHGEGDVGYSMHALKLAKDNKLINKSMSPDIVKEVMLTEGMDPYGFIVDEGMLKELFKE